MTNDESKKLILAHISRGNPTHAVKEALMHNLKELEELNKTIQDLEHTNRALMNRCRVMTGGQLCIFCQCKDKCGDALKDE